MASAEQVKALLRSHIDGDEQHFYAVALQVAANEAKAGHGRLAEELKVLVEKAKHRTPGRILSFAQPRGELADLLSASYPKERFSDIVLTSELRPHLERAIKEQRHAALISEFGLVPRRKLLLVGPPGTGKTMTASVIAGELGLPLFLVRLDGLITKFMGETASKLRLIFEATLQSRGVYFFDEFDAIGSQRSGGNDVGEIRRVLNSFLQMIEQDRSHSLILAATNHPEILDLALLRRFDDVLHYEKPNATQAAQLLRVRTARMAGADISWERLGEEATGLSHAEIIRASEDVLKDALIHDRKSVTEVEINQALSDRRRMAQQFSQK